jgi:hypothetical protein
MKVVPLVVGVPLILLGFIGSDKGRDYFRVQAMLQ